jgi:hypothetical protein
MNNPFNFKGTQFASFDYTNSYGEVKTCNVLLGAKYNVAKMKDLITLRGASFPEQNLEEARVRLVTAIEKNLDPKTQSNQSKGQQDAYIHLTKGFKINKASDKVHLMAYSISTTQSEEQKVETENNKVSGLFKERKKVNSRQATIDQNDVKKALDLRELKLVNFIFSKDRVESARVNGSTLTF